MDGKNVASTQNDSRPMSSPRDSIDPLVPSSIKTPYEEIQHEATQIVNIPNDCWGAFVFLVVNDFPDLRAWTSTTPQKLRFLQVTLCWLLNVAIQGILVYNIYKRLLLPAQLGAQDLYKMFHAEAFNNTALSHELFDQFDDRSDLCGLAIGLSMMNRVILFLWISTNVREGVDILHRLQLVIGLPALPDGCGAQMMVDDRNDGGSVQHTVICADTITKITLCLTVYLPKLIIASVVTYAGSVWLLASESIGDLILNSLALSFVTLVDELIATSFFPDYFQHLLEKSCWGVKPVPEDPTRSHINSFSLLAFTLGVVELTVRCQTTIPGFKNDLTDVCWRFVETQAPWCSPGEEDCFPRS